MKTRKILAWVAVGLAVLAFVWFLCGRHPAGAVPGLKFNDNLQEALKMKQDQSRSAFQLAVVLLGALWTTLLTKKDGLTFELKDWPPVTIFIAGNVLLLASVWCHLRYLEFTSGQLWEMSKGDNKFFPDVVNSHLNNSYFGQSAMLYAGLACTALHLMVVNKFKRTP